MFFVWPDKEEFPQIQFLKEKMTLPGQNSALRAYQQHFYTTANITDILNLKLYKVSKPIIDKIKKNRRKSFRKCGLLQH